MCGIDDFCCDTENGFWDESCADIALSEDRSSSCQCEGTSTCPGDCNTSDSVTINELISCVNIALGSADLSSCAACDSDNSGSVAINELIAAVNAAQSGCP